MTVSLKGATAGSALSNNCRKKTPWACSNPMRLACMHHGEDLAVRCGRWRTCPGCSVWKQWTLKQRFIAGIEQVPAGRLAMFFTLTFPESEAPDEDAAHEAWRSLVGRLRYREQLGAFGWVLQRQRNGTLHYHGIAHMPWFDDDLAGWRRLIVKSGFGVQNRLVVARNDHAGYCARYISTRMAALAPLRRGYGFSRDFPRTQHDALAHVLSIRASGATSDGVGPTPEQLVALRDDFGIELEDTCAYVPAHEVWR